ncbi:MAG: helix-turn-helix domain-containing protein [Actinobacteria bacterium]|nr:helix-turn-helix domain-containing protein [Actinomycetota bacterium]
MDKNEIMTIKDISLYLKINEKTVYKLAKKNLLPGIKIGGMYRFKKDAVDNWIMNSGKKVAETKTKNLDNLDLKEKEKKALLELKKALFNSFSISEIILYGSKARGNFDKESDIDVLVILNAKVNDDLREKIFSLSFKIEMKYDVIFGIIVESKDFWISPLAKAMPIHKNIYTEGVII